MKILFTAEATESTGKGLKIKSPSPPRLNDFDLNSDIRLYGDIWIMRRCGEVFALSLHKIYRFPNLASAYTASAFNALSTDLKTAMPQSPSAFAIGS